jgi:hypothetical protein
VLNLGFIQRRPNLTNVYQTFVLAKTPYSFRGFLLYIRLPTHCFFLIR